MGIAESFWEFAQLPATQQRGSCPEHDSTTREEEAPAGAPDHIERVIVCSECERVVDAE